MGSLQSGGQKPQNKTPNFDRVSAKLGPETPLDRWGSACSAGCTANQPRRPIIRPFCGYVFSSTDSGLPAKVWYPMLCNNVAGPEIGRPGRISVGFQAGDFQNRPSGWPKPAGGAIMRLSRLESGPEARLPVRMHYCITR